MTFSVTLPWPSAALSQNARSKHWGPRARASKAARTAVAWIIRAEVPHKLDWAAVALSVTFCPPDRRSRDMDGCIGRMKALQDGIADAIGIDDKHFIPTYRMGDVVKGGAVLVTISEAK